jgi:glycolate oxidase iron-sulfur subunit
MQTNLSAEFLASPDAQAAAGLIRKCVHCGFCNATCPTYQLLGDELDGPRGRIYLIKQVLEGAPVSRSTQQHLDRCLTCLNCQTTCPSGVEYGSLLEIGRQLVDARVERPAIEKTVRWLLRETLTSPLFAVALRVGRAIRPLLPRILRDKVPLARRPLQRPVVARTRKVLMLQGCVQPSMMPNINAAAARVLDKAGIETLYTDAGCCGALRLHLSDHDGALSDMRRNIDAWSSQLAAHDIEAIVSCASACTLAIKDYAHALAGDAAYAGKAARISALVRDVSELLPALVADLQPQLRQGHDKRVAFHAPCTLQHGLKVRGGVEAQLQALGFKVAAPSHESHLCCGSAGTYSVLQPEIARQLRDRKLANLGEGAPDYILSANVGCIQHLQSGTSTPVMHWIELLDQVLA